MPKKRKPTPKHDSGRETRVLLERISSDVRTVAEQHGSVKEEMTQLRNSMESRSATVEMAVMESAKEIKALKNGQERVEQKLDTTLTNHEQRITKIEEKVE